MGGSLILLLSFLLSIGLFCFFPIRNTVRHRGRPWATWGLIATNLLFCLAAILVAVTGGASGATSLFDQLAFAGDFSRPATLITSQFVHPNLVQMLVSLWLLYLIAPALEQHVKPLGLLALYLGGGALTAALYGALCLTMEAPVSLAGMSCGLHVLMGLCLALYPFEEIVFFYNFLFFAFCGTIRIAMIFLVLFAAVIHLVSGPLGGWVAVKLEIRQTIGVNWLNEIVPLLGLGIGFLFGALRYGLGAFVGKSPTGEVRTSAERMVERALTRMIEGTQESPAASRRLTRHERSQSRLALADGAPPEEIEAFAEQCLRNKRDQLLEAAYTRFRTRFPHRCFGPSLQAEIARRFEQVNRLDLAGDAYRLLLQAYRDSPAALDAPLHLARFLAPDPTAADEAIEWLEKFLNRTAAENAESLRPEVKAQREEARRLLDQLVEQTGRGDTYEGLGPYKPFRFAEPPEKSVEAVAPAEEVPGEKQEFEGAIAEPVGRSGPVEDARSEKQEIAAEKSVGPTEPPLPTREIVPDAAGQTLTSWGFQPATSSEIVAAMAAARTFAVIVLPGRALVADKALALLAEFWMVGPQEAAEQLRRCRGILLDDAPSGRAVVLARKMRSLGLPVTVVPLLPDLIYIGGEDVLEFSWSDSICGNVTASGRRSFGWDQVRLVNLARVGLPGAGSAYRRVLDLFVAQPHGQLRYWENTVNFARSSVGEQRAMQESSLQLLVEYLDRCAPRALQTPSFRAAAKKSGAPLDFHSPAELDHYNRWFFYAGFGKYSADE